jgi:hypothetical protein
MSSTSDLRSQARNTFKSRLQEDVDESWDSTEIRVLRLDLGGKIEFSPSFHSTASFKPRFRPTGKAVLSEIATSPTGAESET